MAIPVILSAVATTVSAVGSYQQGKAQQEQSEIAAAEMERNAQDRVREGLLKAQETRRQKAIALSNARAQQAGSGGSTTSGVSLRQQGDIAGIYEFNAAEQEYASQREAQGVYNAAANTRTEGRMARFNGTVGALSTVLQGSSSIYSSLRKAPGPGKPAGSVGVTRNKTTGFWRAPSMVAP